MKTLQEIKDQYAREQGYADWDDIIGQCAESLSDHWTEVCVLTQKQALKNAAENTIIMMEDIMPVSPGIEPIMLSSWYLQQGMVLGSLDNPVRVSVEKDSIINNKNLIL